MEGKIIITGPGRAGTSFLVCLLTRLGEDTGFEPGNEPFVDRFRAGCEHNIILHLIDGDVTREILQKSPRVLKSPDWSFALKGLIKCGWIAVDHVFIPFRDFEESARSRLEVGLDWMARPDGTLEERIEDQANIHGLAFGRALEACLVSGTPYTVMHFPRLVEDEGYCFRGLVRGFADLDRKEHRKRWKELARK